MKTVPNARVAGINASVTSLEMTDAHVNEFVRVFNCAMGARLRDTDDLVQDFIYLCEMAVLYIPGGVSEWPDDFGIRPPPASASESELGADFMGACAEALYRLNPTFSQECWERLFRAVVIDRRGPGRHYIKKRLSRKLTAKELREAAAQLTALELQKLGVSRGHAFKLRKMALQKK